MSAYTLTGMREGLGDGVTDVVGLDDIGLVVVAAAREEFVRYGIRRANMEQIARRAGVARVTVYRRFNGKPALLRAVIMHDVLEFVGRFDAALWADGPIADRLAAATGLAISELRRHTLLSTLRNSDPEVLLSALTTEGETEFLLLKAVLTTRIATIQERGEISVADPSRTAEQVLRVLYSVLLLPYGELPGTTEEEIMVYVREFVLPLFLDDTRSARPPMP